MPEEELSSCLTSKEPSLGSLSPVLICVGDQNPRAVSPSVPKTLHVPRWTLQAFPGQWGSAGRTEALLRLGIMFSVYRCAVDAQSWDMTSPCTHTDTHTDRQTHTRHI